MLSFEVIKMREKTTGISCLLCGSYVEMAVDGKLHMCRCGAVGIDTTDGYIRFIGEPRDFNKITEVDL